MHVTRRTFLSAATTSATIAAFTPRAFARWSGQDPVRYPDPAFQMVDQSFVRFRPGNAAVERLATLYSVYVHAQGVTLS